MRRTTLLAVLAFSAYAAAVDCNPSGCLNNGICTDVGTDTDGNFTCNCAATAFQGATCEIPNVVGCRDNNPSFCNYLSSANVDGPCYTVCVPGTWSSYGTCDRLCGGGSQNRTCLAGATEAPCVGSSTQACNTQACVNGGWGAWGSCSAVCTPGGTQTRICDTPTPGPGGAACTGSASQPCNTNTPCNVAVNGVWSAWSECSVGCGGGTMTRTCSGPQFGGSPCLNTAGVVASTESKPCNQFNCVNCSYYTNGWTPCTKKCGPFGHRWREVIIQTQSTPGAPVQCPTEKYQNVSCNTNMCYNRLRGRGYWQWKVCGTDQFKYKVGSLTGQNIDMFLFEEGANFDGYRKDVSRGSKVKNFGYSHVSAVLRTENGEGFASIHPDKCYYFVVDYTQVGAATQNPDDWRELYFTYELTGNPRDMQDGVLGEWGVGMAASASLHGPMALSLLVALAVAATRMSWL